ncbi:hypothetical protein [Luteolibacter yonseiensis]|nr:hypothetical protein [Luteolibacter yonseiensis]
MWGGLAVIMGLAVMSTKQTLSYSSVCSRCLATKSGVERSILGIPYGKSHQLIRYLYNTAEEPRLAKFSKGRLMIYEEINGRACGHDFVKTGFCRYRAGSVGCGQFGGSAKVWIRKELILGVFRAFEKIRDDKLAAVSCQLIEREFPLETPQAANGRNLINKSEEQTERDRRMLLFADLLGLVRDRQDWVAVLDYGKNGFQGDPPLLNDPAALSERLRSDNPNLRRKAASILARDPSTSGELIGEMLGSGDEEVVKITGESVFLNKRFGLFGALLRSQTLDEYRRKSMRAYTREEFEILISMNDPSVDTACLDAISKGDRFELLGKALEVANRDPSDVAFKAIHRLLRGPDPFFENEDRDLDKMWAETETLHVSTAALRESMMMDIEGNRGERSKYDFVSAIKSMGATRDVSQWSFLRDGYLKAINGGIGEWWLASMAKAMHELDGPATEAFLIEEIKGGEFRRLSAAFSAMGLISSRVFEEPLKAFVANPPGLPPKGSNPPKYYFFGDGYGSRFLKYALHRCHGVPLWRLVKNTEGKFVIEKPRATSW